MYRERDHSRCESGVVRGEWWWGRVNIEGKYASRSPIVSDLPRLLARHILGPYRSNSGGTARVSDGCGVRVGGGRGVAVRAGWGCSRWCSRSTVGVAIIISLRVLSAACCSVSTGTAVASLRVAFLVGSVRRDDVVRPLGSLSLCHPACRELLARRRSRSICCRCDPPHASTSRCVWREGVARGNEGVPLAVCSFWGSPSPSCTPPRIRYRSALLRVSPFVAVTRTGEPGGARLGRLVPPCCWYAFARRAR